MSTDAVKRARQEVRERTSKIPRAAPRTRITRTMASGPLISRYEIRYMVDQYYQIQEFRKISANQLSALERMEEPSSQFLGEIFVRREAEEKNIEAWLAGAVMHHRICQWVMSLSGLGVIFAAGLLAHITTEENSTAGRLWRFAGLDPSLKWISRKEADALVKGALEKQEKKKPDLKLAAELICLERGVKVESILRFTATDKDGEPRKLSSTNLAAALARRPYNQRLKNLCYLIGESFVKNQAKEDCYYGHVYSARKLLEASRNEKGMFSDQAADGVKRVNRSTEAYKHYSRGLLPPGQIHARARRYAVKLFLSHYHWVSHEIEYGVPPPRPYVIEHLGHTGLLQPPNWPITI